jgi:hypothetical protein
VNLVELTLPETAYPGSALPTMHETISLLVLAQRCRRLWQYEDTISDAPEENGDAPETSLARRRLSALVLGNENISLAADDLETPEAAL